MQIWVGWIESRADRYYCSTDHLVIDQLKHLEFLKKWYLHELSLVQKKANENFENNENLFFTFKFALDKRDRVRLKQDLKNTLSNWVDKNSSDVGEQVTSLTIGLQ